MTTTNNFNRYLCITIVAIIAFAGMLTLNFIRGFKLTLQTLPEDRWAAPGLFEIIAVVFLIVLLRYRKAENAK